ncbi:PTS glucose transporter subunit IIA [Paenibacillus albiflavus]|uniref:PTS glucose transporter subunit IIA n=1 Tax=Paenibacillus albiflavus TaxID=2545760 RepID=A0A4R4E408_9BACL|nr:PTS glucose transporter subunit IIA [Paenibacillus albiflavus]TCZ73420.1 PTS glucose transporter subunit IIA [Paenibacillus albiflavus]
MFFKKKGIKLVAPLSGTAVSLEEVPDPAFSQGLIGDGIAIKPNKGVLVSPCDGEVAHLIDTYHSVIIAHKSGLEVLMHIGVNTVSLKGEGFNPLVKMGDAVKQGQPLIEFDIAAIEAKGFPVITPIIMANAEVVSKLTKKSGSMTAGETLALEVEVK